MRKQIFGVLFLTVFGLTFFLSSTAAAVASANQINFSKIISGLPARLKLYDSAVIAGSTRVVTYKEAPLSPAVAYRDNIKTSQLLAIWNRLLKSGLTRRSKFTVEQNGREVIYRVKLRLTSAQANEFIKLYWPFIDINGLTAAQLKTFKPRVRGITYAEVQVFISGVTSLPTGLKLTWVVQMDKKKPATVQKVSSFISYFKFPQTTPPPAAAPAATFSATTSIINVLAPLKQIVSESKVAFSTTSTFNNTSVPESDAPPLSSVIVQAPSGAMNFRGEGGVTASQVAHLDSIVNRDQQRLNDLEAIKQALQFFYKDQNYYPQAVKIKLGSAGYACLNSDGFNQADCPYPYLLAVPKDPLDNSFSYEYSVVYNQNNLATAYLVLAKLEGQTDSLSGSIKLTPSGVVKN